MIKYLSMSCLAFSFITVLTGQSISDFVPLIDYPQNEKFAIPVTHTFQKIIEKDDPLTAGGTLMGRNDFTAFISNNNSSINGHLSINHEQVPGGVSVLDIQFDEFGTRLWNVSASEALDFTSVGGTARNCSGGITPWGTILTCEEIISTEDVNMDGYNDLGWAVELNPFTKTVLGKRWAMGNFKHENATIHSNERTVYQGNDDALGYLYKFVATNPQDLTAGNLYVYKGPKSGTTGTWELVANSSISDRNTTVTQSTSLGATDFDFVEDVEIGPDGYIYFTSKAAGTVYRFIDSDPISGTTVPMIETFVDGIPGCDNLAFDCEGNLWIYQDGVRNHIWVVKSGSREKEIFARLPSGSEPTGITFSPDCRFLFMSIQHPSSSNLANQQDAAGDVINFEKSISLVIGRKEVLGTQIGCSLNITSSVIASGDDDVEEYSDGTMYMNSSDLELTTDPAEPIRGQQSVGLKFNNVLVPSGVRILTAYLQFTTDEVSIEPTSLLIQAEASVNAAPYTMTNFNLSNRQRTAACVFWSDIAGWSVVGQAGPDQKSPNLKAVVEEVIDQPGWAEGNSINFIITGTGRRTAESFESGLANTVELIIEFETCPLSNCSFHGDVSLIGNLPTGTTTVGRDLIIKGNMIPNNSYFMTAGKSITLKPGTEVCNCGVVNMAIENCED